MIRRIAFFAFPRITLLDLVGVWHALRRVPGVEVQVVGTAAELCDESGFVFRPAAVLPDLAGFDLLIVPGGLGIEPLLDDEGLVAWVRSWGHGRPLASVCSGALLIGKAGHLARLRATTHHQRFAQLAPYCAQVVTGERVVDEGRVVTAGGVTAALDLGLHLVGKHWGAAERARIARQIEYVQGSQGAH